jgi:hypothetical protein
MFKCDQCDKSFGRKSHLQRHIKLIHQLLKPFKCENCDKSFGEKHNLHIHIKAIHQLLKPYTCEHCDKSFGQKSNLQRHIRRIHTNPKPRNMSRGEMAVKDVLETLNLEYVQEKTFPELVGLSGGHLRYDFAIVLNEEEQQYLFIEYDGKQHYKKVRWQNNTTDEQVNEQFKRTKRHDRIKNRFAIVHDYPLLRIKYTDYNNIHEMVQQFVETWVQ